VGDALWRGCTVARERSAANEFAGHPVGFDQRAIQIFLPGRISTNAVSGRACRPSRLSAVARFPVVAPLSQEAQFPTRHVLSLIQMRSEDATSTNRENRQGIVIMEDRTLKERVAQIKWFHQIDLRNGIVTPGRDYSAAKLAELRMPEDLTGLSVLDVGAWDGFFSFEAERRGARRVLATDWFCWNGPGWGTRAGFDLAREVLNSKVEDAAIDVLDLSPEKVGLFDLVLFLGVLYHMRHPLLALERIRSVTAPGGRVILETHLDLTWVRRPALAFYPGEELVGDETNWCGPNAPGVEAMLRSVGFSRVAKVSEQSDGFLRRIVHSTKRRVVRGEGFFLNFGTKRAVFHAWR
jgi:tRNA (mo5U34)-methyltransferase